MTRSTVARVATIAVTLQIFASTALAIEIGVDGVVETQIYAHDQSAVDISPVPVWLRCGFRIGQCLQIEPRVSYALQYERRRTYDGIIPPGTQTTTTVHAFAATLDALVFLGHPDRGACPYIRVDPIFVALRDDSGSETRAGIAGGVGVRLPVRTNAAARFDVTFGRLSGSGNFEPAWVAAATLGFSVLIP